MAGQGEQAELLARRWDEVAGRYEEYFVPRFRPWVVATVEAVVDGESPAGPILVPCCGTFPELPLLAGRFGGREVVGLDISAGMVSRDERLAFEMVHTDAAEVWEAMTAAAVGPLHGAALRHGPEVVERMRREFLQRAPTGEWRHRRPARLIVADRQSGQAA